MYKMALAALLVSALAVYSCHGNSGCESGKLACGDYCCPDSTHYSCSSEKKCVLVSCDQGLQLCGPGCIDLTASCCDQNTGTYCQTGMICCGLNFGCIPTGATCCGDSGSYCPAGKVCCYDNTKCC